jgi:hypothetical protein
METRKQEQTIRRESDNAFQSERARLTVAPVD